MEYNVIMSPRPDPKYFSLIPLCFVYCTCLSKTPEIPLEKKLFVFQNKIYPTKNNQPIPILCQTVSIFKYKSPTDPLELQRERKSLASCWFEKYVVIINIYLYIYIYKYIYTVNNGIFLNGNWKAGFRFVRGFL